MTTRQTALFLRDFDNYDLYAQLPRLEAAIQSIDLIKGDLPAGCNCDGSFWIHGGTSFGLARIEGRLLARIGDVVFELSKDLTIDVTGSPPNRSVVVKRHGVPCLTVPYVLRADVSLPQDETPFVENEDFDYGLFLANISHSEERKKIMLE